MEPVFLAAPALQDNCLPLPTREVHKKAYYSQNADNKGEEKNANNSQRKKTPVIQAVNRNNGRQNLMLFHFENDKKKNYQK